MIDWGSLCQCNEAPLHHHGIGDDGKTYIRVPWPRRYGPRPS